ncbi:MAG: endo alpha-1,4 polygalactosaminidase [Bacteroidetes bacterium]|nr:MAG: endo alpha-1,4 polygalactosaminidase [Bacteroidota bacterium]
MIRIWIFLVLFFFAACQRWEVSAPSAAGSESGLPPITSWQIQYSGELDLDLDIDVFNLDLFDTPIENIKELKKRGVFVICYFSAGSYEDWRPDADQFPDKVLGNSLDDWPGERWLDIRQIPALSPIIESRMDLAVAKGCDGVDPDNLDGYENKTGFPLTGNDQLVFNRYLAQTAHTRELKIGLKNDINQIHELVNDFDWILNEECFTYHECDLLLPFFDVNKPVFVIEYEISPAGFCPQANQQGFSALHKNWDLDAYYTDCLKFPSQ